MPTLVRNRLERLNAANPERLTDASLYELVPRLNPGFVAPLHMAPIVEAIEASLREKIRVVISAPPQHGKSVMLKVALIQRLLRSGPRYSAYCAYNTDRAEDVSLEAQWLADAAGIAWSGNRRKWGVERGPSILWTGIGGGLTGSPVNDLLVIDDPIKDREEARSRVYRDRAWNWLTSVAFTRLHPGTSVLQVATRWHEDDVAGRLIRAGWDNINLPAVNDEGEALWPEQRPISFLEEQRREIGERDFAALYQGKPRPDGEVLFKEPHYYDSLPDARTFAHGCDLAYTAKTSADYSAIVTLLRDGNLYYVVDVRRAQCDAPTFCRVLQQQAEIYPGRMVWHGAGPEKGSAQFILSRVPHFEFRAATVDKLIRATPVSNAWNEGRVLLPSESARKTMRGNGAWVGPFLAELTGFTGQNDPHDDQVDALASAFSALQLPARRLDVSALPPF
jgi:predicted phage terminase large subunit-like protein